MLDLIHEKGPEGSFLTHEHTLDHFREHWYPKLFERGNYSQWEKAGSKSLGERAAELVEQILARSPRNALPADVAEAVHAVLLNTTERSTEGQ
jgi:trimethylamine---corrinoid protein Co-methyltransferase